MVEVPRSWMSYLFADQQNPCIMSDRLQRQGQNSGVNDTQRHTLRDIRPSTAAWPACWAIEKNRIEIVYSEEKNLTELTRAAKAEQKLLYRHDKPNEPTKKGPLSFVLFESPHSPQFQQSAGATHLQSLWCSQCNAVNKGVYRYTRLRFFLASILKFVLFL